MKALVLEEYNNLVYEDVPEPDIGADEVLIQVKACGICGSDVHGMDGSTGRRLPPLIMGHEASGVIARTGAQVQGFAEGDRVTFDSTIYCGECFFCRRGEINLCDNRQVLGVACEEHQRDGAFAEYVAVPQRILYPLPENVSFEHAAMVEPVSIAVHAAAITPIALNDAAVVVGTGMIGLLAVQTLRAAGCGTIVAVDIDPRKLDLALELGADYALRPDQADVPAEVSALTDGRGAELAFEVVGSTAAFTTAINSVKKGGAVTLIGNLAPQIDFPLQVAVARQITVRGSCASSGEFPVCLDLIARGAINVDALRSATAPLSEGAAWFEKLYRGEDELMKVILTP
jgi:L-iditol 2-dehydrogenase